MGQQNTANEHESQPPPAGSDAPPGLPWVQTPLPVTWQQHSQTGDKDSTELCTV